MLLPYSITFASRSEQNYDVTEEGLEKMYISREAYRNFPWAACGRRSSFYDVTKEICFPENVALKSLTITAFA